jgi:hypothetical protein
MTIKIHFDNRYLTYRHNHYVDSWFAQYLDRELQDSPEIWVTVEADSTDDDITLYKPIGHSITTLIDTASEYYGGWYVMDKESACELVSSCITCALRVYDVLYD